VTRVQDADGMTELVRFGSRLGDDLRAVIVASPDADIPELPGCPFYHDTGNSAVRIASKQGAF